LSPDPYTLGVTDDRSAGQVYTQQFEVIAAPGYYWSTPPAIGNISGLPSYASVTGIAFADSGEAFPTIIILTISVNGHPTTAPTEPITLGINTTLLVSPAVATIQLNRLNVANITSNPQENITISYNFSLGYYVQLVYNTIPGYVFTNTNVIPGIFYVTGFFQFSPVPPVGGGTIAISNFAYTNNNTTLTMNVSLTGIPTTGYLTAINYGISVNVIPTAPKITLASAGYYIFANGGTQPNVSVPLQVTNSTPSTVFIWVGVLNNNVSGGTQAIVNASFTVGAPFQPNYNIIIVQAAAPVQTYYSFTNIALPSGGVINGFLTRSGQNTNNSTNDTHHTVQLYWSSASDSPVNERYPITI
jgi:hypothetical protein